MPSGYTVGPKLCNTFSDFNLAFTVIFRMKKYLIISKLWQVGGQSTGEQYFRNYVSVFNKMLSQTFCFFRLIKLFKIMIESDK